MTTSSSLNHSISTGDKPFPSCSSFLTIDLEKEFPANVLPHAIIAITINGIAIPLIIYVNILIFYTICKDQRLRSTSYNVLLAGLSLNDLFVGVVVQPTYVIYRVCGIVKCPLECPMTFVYAGVLMFFTSWSLNTLMILSLERYLSIHHPLSYNSVVSSNKVKVGTVLIWVAVPTSMLLTVILGSDLVVRKIFIVLGFGSNVLVTVFATVQVHRAAHIQRRSVAAQQAAVQGEQARKINECKQAFAIGAVVLTTVGLYCPLIAYMIGMSIKGDEMSDELKVISGALGATLVHMQSFINPLILSLRLSHIREGVKRKMCCFKTVLRTEIRTER